MSFLVDPRWRGARAALAATGGYTLIALVMTWPLATGLTRDLPADHGDNLLNVWILGWGADSLVGMLTGVSTWRDWWNANIFHPSPLALAYSEHLFALVVQVLPVYLLTDNLILCYNLLFLSTFVLSGLGTYLLVTDITGSRAAGFVAGLFYAFVPYRVTQFAHLQVLSSQWMPFALFGFRRHLATGHWRPLVGASAALVMQNLSCGYYLLFFAPIVPAFVLMEMAARGLLGQWRVWAGLGIAAAAVLAATLPFLLPYVELRALEGVERSIPEIEAYSPDLFGYAAAHESLWLWGPYLRTGSGPEGDLFLGAVPLILALTALVLLARNGWDMARQVPPPATRHRWWVRASAVAALAAAAAVATLTFVGPMRTELLGVTFRMTDGTRPLLLLLASVAGLLALSPRARVATMTVGRSPVLVAWALLWFAVIMSLGPTPSRGGIPVDLPAPYGFFVEHVPGFDGLRVPGRYAMIAALFLAIPAGVTLAHLARAGRAGNALLAAFATLFLAEAAVMPIEINRVWGEGAYRDAPVVRPAREAPPLYRYLAGLPPGTVVLELPLGDVGWDLRAVYYASVHRHRLVNGYSGGFPRAYRRRQVLIEWLVPEPALAWEAIVSSGATHVVVHEHAYWGDRADRVRSFLETHGAVLERDFGEGELLYRVPRQARGDGVGTDFGFRH
jgi:hypothetical protein